MKRKNNNSYRDENEDDFRKISLSKVKEEKVRKQARNFRNALKSKDINALMSYDDR